MRRCKAVHFKSHVNERSLPTPLEVLLMMLTPFE